MWLKGASTEAKHRMLMELIDKAKETKAEPIIVDWLVVAAGQNITKQNFSYKLTNVPSRQETPPESQQQ